MPSTLTPRELFERVLDLSGPARAKLLIELCVDTALRAELEQLLAADAMQDDLPGSGDAVVAALAIGDTSVATQLPPGSEVGPFTLIEVLGEGGSATVFHAFREEHGVRQEVALKVLARGLYSDESQRQFRREREALARLHHPGIARLIEGGITPAGLAYIALELVDGMPITSYARQHALGVRRRLGLFLTVCRVVQAAHRALIVHRDLKPSNVLVTDEGDIKLLDFGIAQLLDEDVEGSPLGPTPALTPAYAAPEQFAYGAVTAAADVYALGVLLNELLCDHVMQRSETQAPSCAGVKSHNVRRTTDGELGHIVRKATAMEPTRRYACAGALADDIKRHLSRQPVLAYSHSRWYRLRKRVVRYRAGFATAAGLMLAMGVALGMALWQAGMAREQATRANQVRDFMVSVFQSAAADLPKNVRPTPENLLEQATTQLMASNHLPDAQRVDLLLAMAKVAQSLGADAKALALLDRGAPIIQRLYAPDDRRWWDAQVLRAAVLEDEARDQDVIRLMRPLRDMLALRHDRIGIDGLRLLGNALLHEGQIDRGLELLDGARQSAAQSAFHDLQLSASIDEGTALLSAGRYQAGFARANAALALWQAGDQPLNPRIIDLYAAVARGAEATGEMARAEHAYRLAISTGDRFFDKPSPQQAWNVGTYGAFLTAQGRFVEAEPLAMQALELRRHAFGNDDPRTLDAIAGMGQLRYAQGRYKQARDWYAQGVESCRRSLSKKPVCPRLLGLRGLAWSATGTFDKAAADIRAALDTQRNVDGGDSPAYADILRQLASLQLARHQYAESVATADQVLAIYRRAGGGMIPRELDTRLARAQAMFSLGRNDEVLRELRAIEPAYQTMFAHTTARFEVVSLSANALARAHRDGDAARAARKALTMLRLSTRHDPKLIAELTRIATGKPSGQ